MGVGKVERGVTGVSGGLWDRGGGLSQPTCSGAAAGMGPNPFAQGKQGHKPLAVSAPSQGRFYQSQFVINDALKAASLWPGEINWPEM